MTGFYAVRMIDENGESFYKNHAYKNTWGSRDMAQTFEYYDEAKAAADDMPKYKDCKIITEYYGD